MTWLFILLFLCLFLGAAKVVSKIQESFDVHKDSQHYLSQNIRSGIPLRILSSADAAADATDEWRRVNENKLRLQKFEAYQECPKCGNYDYHWIRNWKQRGRVVKRQCRSCGFTWEQK